MSEFLRKKDLLTYLRLIGDYYEDLVEDIESGMFDWSGESE